MKTSPWTLAVVGALALTWANVAVAKPMVGIDDTGLVVGTVVLKASVDEVKAALKEPGTSADVLEMKITNRGPCDEIFRKVKGMWTPLTYTALRCPTATGYIETLHASEDFTEYRDEWKIIGQEGGTTKVVHTLRTAVNLSVPQSMVNSGLKRGVTRSLNDLLKRFPEAE